MSNPLEMEIDRIPPYNLEAEKAVLGACLLDKDALNTAINILTPQDFYDEFHAKCFEIMTQMAIKNKAVDGLTFLEELKKRNIVDETEGQAFIADVIEATPTIANIEYHAQIVKEKSLRRKLIQTAKEIAKLGYDESQEVNKAIDQAEQLVFKIAEKKHTTSFIHISDVLKDTFESIEESFQKGSLVTGIPSGFPDLDRLTAGFQRGSLNIVAARPSMGKTAFALNIAQHVAIRHKIPVLIFSLEMSADQLAQRMLASEAKVNIHSLRTGMFPEEAWEKLIEAAGRLHQSPIYIDDTSYLSSLDLRAKARRFKAEHPKLGLIIVDYLQLMHLSYKVDTKQQEVAEISRSLKAVARELDLPVIALSQLSRAVEQRQDKKPQLSDLRDSGAIEQDADLVIFIYRPDVYQTTPPDSDELSTADIIIAKHRNGPTGTIQLAFFKEYATFESIAVSF